MVRSARVLAALKAFPLKLFVDPGEDGVPEDGGPQGGDLEEEVHRWIALVAALEILSSRLPPSPILLDIGTGSGLVAALLSHLIAPSGLVHSFERDPLVALRARTTLTRHLSPPALACLELHVGPAQRLLPSLPLPAEGAQGAYIGACLEGVPTWLMPRLAHGAPLICALPSEEGGQMLVRVDQRRGGPMVRPIMPVRFEWLKGLEEE